MIELQTLVALGKLDPLQREAVIDIGLCGFTVADVARRDHVSERAIQLRLAAARRHLGERFVSLAESTQREVFEPLDRPDHVARRRLTRPERDTIRFERDRLARARSDASERPMCRWCGEEFTRSPKGQHRLYCCTHCRQAAYSHRQWASDPAWHEQKNTRGREWLRKTSGPVTPVAHRGKCKTFSEKQLAKGKAHGNH